MGRDTDQIRKEIESTRDVIGDDLQTLADQANVKKRLSEKIAKFTEVQDGQELNKAQQAVEVGKKIHLQHPWVLPTVGAITVGFVSGRFTKSSAGSALTKQIVVAVLSKAAVQIAKDKFAK